MSRLLTCGAETKDVNTSGSPTVEGGMSHAIIGTGAAITADGGTFRSGSFSFKYTSGSAGGSLAKSTFTFTGIHGTDYFFRIYVNFPANPTATTAFILFATNGGNIYSVKIDSSGHLGLYNNNTQIGVNTGVISLGSWLRVEIRIRTSATPSSTQVEALLDGSSIASSSTVNDSTISSAVQMGWNTDAGTTKSVYVDDVALNDSNGTSCNSWPGSGKVVLLLPTANSSIGNWLSGSGTSGTNDGNQWDAVNNTPPVGTTSPDATTACISNKVSGASGAGNGDFTMATYTAAGVTAGSTVNCVQQWIAHGEDASTNTKTGTFAIVSNPSSGTANNVSEGGSNQFGPAAGGAVGTYPANWVAQGGTIVHLPTVTLGTAPVARITKTDTGTRSADCCFLGIYVDYTPSSGTLKTANTLARASIKTIDTLAIGSVKTYDGLTP